MDSYKELAKRNKALGNERRLHILRYLRNQGAKSVGEIAKEVRIGIRPTSKHLQLLESVGFLEQRRKGMFVHYNTSSSSNSYNLLSPLTHPLPAYAGRGDKEMP